MNNENDNQQLVAPTESVVTDNQTVPAPKKRMTTAEKVTLVVIGVPFALIVMFIVGIFISSNRYYNNNDEFKTYLDNKYGASEDFSYVSDGNVYMGHREKNFRSDRTGKTFLIKDSGNGFSDDYWSIAYGTDVDNYLSDILDEVMPYGMKFVSEGSLRNSSDIIPSSTKGIIESDKMAINVTAKLKCNNSSSYCDGIEDNGIDIKTINNNIKKVLNENNINSIQSISLEVEKYSHSDECPEGLSSFDRKCTAVIYSR